MRVEELERELRAERIEPDPDFARQLDEWAAAGFPRQGKPGALERLRSRLTLVPPRRMLLRAGAVATVVVVAGVAISRVDIEGGSDDSAQFSAQPPADVVLDAARSGGSSGGGAAGGGGGGGDLPTQPDAASVPESAGLGARSSDELLAEPAASSAAEAAPASPADVGPAGRKQAQRVDLSLSTSPQDFRDAADGVLDVVATHRGFVVESRVSGGDPGFRNAQLGQATFQLKIPARQLPSALAALSDLGHVVSRTDGTKDITSRFADAKRRIALYTNARQNLLEQLEAAVTVTEQQSIRARLRIVQAELSAAQEDLASAQQRVHLVPVSVSIAADPSVGKDDESDDSGWTLGDALNDARDVLTVLAGIALVSLAVLVPLALVGLLLWWVAARIQRQRREAALE